MGRNYYNSAVASSSRTQIAGWVGFTAAAGRLACVGNRFPTINGGLHLNLCVQIGCNTAFGCNRFALTVCLGMDGNINAQRHHGSKCPARGRSLPLEDIFHVDDAVGQLR